MKKLFIPMLVLAISFSVSAQEKREMRQEKDKMHKGRHKAGKRHDMMETLNLTETQKTQMKALREEYKKQMLALEQDQNITVKESNERKAALKKQQKAGMESLLTAEQKSKMADAKLKRQGESKEHAEMKLEKMKTKLSLSDDQVGRLRTLREQTHAQTKAIRENETLSPDQKKQHIMALKNSAKEQHRKILNAEQLKKMEEFKQDNNNRKRSKK